VDVLSVVADTSVLLVMPGDAYTYGNDLADFLRGLDPEALRELLGMRSDGMTTELRDNVSVDSERGCVCAHSIKSHLDVTLTRSRKETWRSRASWARGARKLRGSATAGRKTHTKARSTSTSTLVVDLRVDARG
jgi:hypothetical protein